MTFFKGDTIVSTGKLITVPAGTKGKVITLHAADGYGVKFNGFHEVIACRSTDLKKAIF